MTGLEVLNTKSTIKALKTTYGFINGDEGKDIFFHESNLKDVNFHELKVGSTVEYEVRETEKGLEAYEIVLSEESSE